MAFPPPWTLFWVAGWLELIGSLLLLVGLFTRPVAFLLAGEMAIAYWMIHAPESFFPIINRGETADPVLLHLPAVRGDRSRHVERRRRAAQAPRPR